MEDKLTSKRIRQLLERQGFRCALTGWVLEPGTASLDHIIPISRDGAHAAFNAQILDHRVNRAKNTMTNEEFVAMCRAVVEHVDRATQAQENQYASRIQ